MDHLRTLREDELIRQYRQLEDGQQRSVHRYIERLLEHRSRFDWRHLATAWPDIWPVIASEMSGRDFEDFVAIILARHGYQYDASLRRSRDHGVDLFRTTQDDESIIIECKLRGKRAVGVQEVRKLVGACIPSKVDRAMMVTNVLFTDDARSYASTLSGLGGAGTRVRVELVDYRRLSALIERPECSDLREFFIRPNLRGLQGLLRDTKRSERYIERRLELFGMANA